MSHFILNNDETQDITGPLRLSKAGIQRKKKENLTAESLFSSHEREWLIKKLFNGIPGQFQAFIFELNTKNTWPEAFHFMEAELSKRKKDLLSREGILITDRAFHVFFPEDINIE